MEKKKVKLQIISGKKWWQHFSVPSSSCGALPKRMTFSSYIGQQNVCFAPFLYFSFEFLILNTVCYHRVSCTCNERFCALWRLKLSNTQALVRSNIFQFFSIHSSVVNRAEKICLTFQLLRLYSLRLYRVRHPFCVLRVISTRF